MSDFAQTMKDWRRMCEANDREYGIASCEHCRIYEKTHHICGAIWDIEAGTDWEAIESAVSEWAEEHPEPQYPTWGEYLCNIGLINDCTESDDAIYRLFHNTIPADIAEKLGVEPK